VAAAFSVIVDVYHLSDVQSLNGQIVNDDARSLLELIFEDRTQYIDEAGEKIDGEQVGRV